jgi:hypothetical protein
MTKYTLPILLCGFMMCACNNSIVEPGKDPATVAKAQKMIQEKIAASLDKNASSYESVQFSPLDSCFENLNADADPNKKYPKIFSGFQMTHTFKALDIFNQLHTERRIFYFNAAIDKIIVVKDIGMGN